MSVYVSLILDTRRVKKDGKFPVKLRLTYQRIVKTYSTIFNLTVEEWNKLNKPRLAKELKQIENELDELKEKVKSFIKEIFPFDFNEFVIRFIDQECRVKNRKHAIPASGFEQNSFDFEPYYKKFPILNSEFPTRFTLGYYFQSYIKKLIQQESISTAIQYHNSYVSFRKFSPDLSLPSVTVLLLHNYERWMKLKDISKTTMGMYIRPIRTLFNEAIADGIIKRERCYPFGKRKYIIPTSTNIKKALNIEEIRLIYYYQCDSANINEQKAKDFWLFSYFANGINPKDIALLKYKNIEDDIMSFERSKTENHFRNKPKLISIYLSDDLKRIIKRWGNENKSPNNYIFPILQNDISPLRQLELIHLFIQNTNEWMGRISEKLSLSRKATTYVARHSFSTILKRSGASTEYIQEALGHSSVITTENYLGSFETTAKKKYAKMLEAFKEMD